MRGRQPPPAQRFIARGSEPFARQAERSGKRGCGGGSPHLPRVSQPAVASRLQDKPSAEESGDVGAEAFACDSRILKASYTSETTRESAPSPRQSGGLGAVPPTSFK
jgi:hypothetical protein